MEKNVNIVQYYNKERDYEADTKTENTGQVITDQSHEKYVKNRSVGTFSYVKLYEIFKLIFDLLQEEIFFIFQNFCITGI